MSNQVFCGPHNSPETPVELPHAEKFESVITLSQNSIIDDIVATRLLLTKPPEWYDRDWRVSFTTFFSLFVVSAPKVELGSGLKFDIVPNNSNSFPFSEAASFNLDRALLADNQGDYHTAKSDSAGDRHTFPWSSSDIHKGSCDDAVANVGVNFRDSLKSAQSRYWWDNGALMDSSIAVWIEYNATRQILQQ